MSHVVFLFSGGLLHGEELVVVGQPLLWGMIDVTQVFGLIEGLCFLIVGGL